MPLKLFEKLLGKSPAHSVPAKLYQIIADQSRNPEFFSSLKIDDSVLGRTDMLTLHVFLFTHRLKYVEQEERELAGSLSQDVFDLFVKDLERGLREIGFADGGVHKRKKKLVRSYYAMVDEFDPPLKNKELGKLRELVGKRFFGDKPEQPELDAIAGLESYISRSVEHLETQTFSTLCSGRIEWPEILA